MTIGLNVLREREREREREQAEILRAATVTATDGLTGSSGIGLF